MHKRGARALGDVWFVQLESLGYRVVCFTVQSHVFIHFSWPDFSGSVCQKIRFCLQNGVKSDANVIQRSHTHNCIKIWALWILVVKNIYNISIIPVPEPIFQKHWNILKVLAGPWDIDEIWRDHKWWGVEIIQKCHDSKEVNFEGS